MGNFKVLTCPACDGTGKAKDIKGNENIGAVWSLRCNVCYGMGTLRVPAEQPPACDHRADSMASASSFCA